MRALVTGAAGFAGRHLLAALSADGHEPLGTGLAGSPRPPGDARWADLDVTDGRACRALLEESRPGWIFHLAGFAHVGKAETEPEECLRVNFGGTRALLEAALAVAPRTRVILVSSAEVYGRAPAGLATLTEDVPLRPSTAYGVSKAAAEAAAQHAVARGLDVVILRPFNHIGPGQSDDFAASSFAHQLARIETGRQEPVLRVGNLTAVRDLTDARDVAAAYVRAAGAARAGEAYNVTSGCAVGVKQVLEELRALARVPVRVEEDASRFRAVDVPVIHGSGEKLAADTGVRLTLDLRRTLGDVLDYWRASEVPDAARR